MASTFYIKKLQLFNYRTVIKHSKKLWWEDFQEIENFLLIKMIKLTDLFIATCTVGIPVEECFSTKPKS